MHDYILPFSISIRMLGLVSEISKKVSRINSYKDLESKSA